MAAPIASWNSQRDVWETAQGDLISGHCDVFSETFPTSGSMRSGMAYASPTLGDATDGGGCSSSPSGETLPPTPTTQDAANKGGRSQFERNTPPLNAVVTMF